MIIEPPRHALPTDYGLLVRFERNLGVLAYFEADGAYLSVDGGDAPGVLYRLTPDADETEFTREHIPAPNHADTPDLDQVHDWWAWEDLADGYFSLVFTTGEATHAVYLSIVGGYITEISDTEQSLRDMLLRPPGLDTAPA